MRPGVFLLAAVFALGCSKDVRRSSGPAPDWMARGSGVFDDPDGQYVHGVGTVEDIKNERLALAAADDRARAEVFEIVNAYFNSILAAYARSIGKSMPENCFFIQGNCGDQVISSPPNLLRAEIESATASGLEWTNSEARRAASMKRMSTRTIDAVVLKKVPWDKTKIGVVAAAQAEAWTRLLSNSERAR